MNTKIIRKIASIMMVLAIMFSTLATPVSNIGKVIVQATEEAAIVTDEAPTDEVGDVTTSDTETAPIDTIVNSDVEDPNALVSSDTDPPADVVTAPTEEPTAPAAPTIPTEEPTAPAAAAPTEEPASALEAPVAPGVCDTNTPVGELHFVDAAQMSENGELVNKIGLEYTQPVAGFNSDYTVTSVRLVEDEVNAGDSAGTVNALTLVGPIANPSLAEFDVSKVSVLPPVAGAYTATWDLKPLDIFRIQQAVTGSHTNIKIYYQYTDNETGCSYTAVTDNKGTELIDKFQVDVPDPEVTIEACPTNCTSVKITVNYEDFKNALDITDVQYTSYKDYYDNATIQIMLKDPLSGVPIALDLDGTMGAPNTTIVDLSGPNNNLTEQVFCIDLTPYYTNPDGSINPALYENHTYTTNILEPDPSTADTTDTMVIADVDKDFALPAPLAIDTSILAGIATDDNKIDFTYKVAANDYLAADLAGSIVITNPLGEVMDTITLTGTEIKDSATTASTKTSNVAYLDGTTYRVTLNVYAKNSSGAKINCSEATAYRDVRMQTTPTLVAAECITNCTSVTLTPTIDTTFYAGKVMRLYINDGESQIQLDLDSTAGVSYYQLINSSTSGTPFCIDLTTVFPTTDGSIDPRVYLPHTYTLKVFANDTATTPLKTVTSNEHTVKQPPIISGLTTVAEYNNHITIDYIVDDKSFDNLTGEIRIYSSDGATLIETINLSESDIDGGVAKTSVKTYEPGVTYKIVLDVYAKDQAGNIIRCSSETTNTTVTMKTAPEVSPYQVCDDGCNVTFDFTYDGSMYPVGSDINILATNTRGTATTSDDVVLPIQKVGDTVADDNTTVTLKFLLPNNTPLYTELLYTEYHYDISIDASDGYDPTVGTDFTLLQPPTTTPLEMSYIPSTGAMEIGYNYSKNGFSSATASIEITKDGSNYQTINVTDTTSDTIILTGLEPGTYSAKLTIKYSIGQNECIDVTSTSRSVTISYPNPSVTPYQTCDDGCDVTFDLSYDGTMYPVGSKIYLSVYDKNHAFLKEVEIGATKAGATTVDTLTYTLDDDIMLYDNHYYTFRIDVAGVTADPTISTSFELKEAPVPVTFNMNYAAGEITFDYDIDVNDFSSATARIDLYKDGAITPMTTIPITTALVDGHITDSITIDGLEPGVYKSILVIDYAIDGIDCEPVTKDSRDVTVAYPNPTVTPYQTCDDGCDVTFDLSYDGTKYPTGSKIYLSVYDKDHNFLKEVEIGATKAGATTVDTLTYTLDDDIMLYDNHYYTFRIDIPSVTADPMVETSFELKEAPIPVTFDMNYAAGVITFDYDIDVNDFSGATAHIGLYKDGATTPTTTIPITTAVADGHITDSITISGLEPGVYKSILVIDYAIDGVDCEPVTKDSRDITVAYPNPTLRSYQACDDGCDVSFDLSYDGTKYPTGSKIYLSVYDKDHNFLKEVEIGATKAGAATVDNLTYTLPNDSILYDIHSYAFRIDIPGVTADPTVEADFELKEAPTPLAFDMNYAAGALSFDFDIDVKDFIGTKVRIDLYKDGVLIPTVVPLSNIVKDGHIAELITIDKLEPGVYSAKLVIDYAINGVDCEPLIAESRAIPVAYAAPSVQPYQICDDDCNVTFDLTYDGSTYPSGSPIHFITYDSEGEVATDTIVGNTSSAVDAKDTFKYDLAADDLTKDALFDAYNYTFKIDIAGVLADPFIDTTYTLLEKPSITTFDTSYAAGEITINYDYSANDFADASAYISISKDGEHFDDINFEDFSGTIVLDHMLPGVYTAELIINYAIDGVDCVAINQVNAPITVAYPNPSITPSQDCNKDCIVDIELDYDASMYPIDSEVVVLKDDMEVLRYSITDMSHNVEGTNMYNYELTVEDFDKHDYVVYIDTMMDEEVLPYSETIEFALLEKPEVKSLNLAVNNDDSITAKYNVALNGYPDATGILVITGPNGYVKEYSIDSDTLASGSFTTGKLAVGEYEAMLTINYGEECPPVTFKSNMVEIEKQLVYTGLETSAFEAFIIKVKELVLHGVNTAVTIAESFNF